MSLGPANLRAPVLAGVLAVLAWPGVAQTKAPAAGQPIIFSAPAGDHGATNLPAPPPQAANPPDFANAPQAPPRLLNMQPPDDSQPALPPPTLTRSSAETRRLQNLLDLRDNWALMTPAEILGVSASGNPSRATDGSTTGQNGRNLTAVERFLQRQQALRNPATNAFDHGDTAPRWNLSWNLDELTGKTPSASGRNDPAATASAASRFFDSASGNPDAAAQNPDGAWTTAFRRQPAQSAQSASDQQLAAMERFKQLLSPRPANDLAAKSSPGSKFLSSTPPLLDTTPDTASAISSIGVSVAPLNSGLARPVGAIPLPDLTTTNWAPPPPPSWAPQPPPWLSPQSPQPFGVPARKF